MFDEGALAISVPAPEWKSSRPPGSVFLRRDIGVQPFSAPLLRALDLVASACTQAGFEPVFVARPEIFTHGESLAWLTAKLGPMRDHLSFSDGATIKLIPGLRNHVFFYGLSRQADSAALDRLKRRFPELFGAIHSQVNSAMQFGPKIAPAPVAIEGAAFSAATTAFHPISLPVDEGLKRKLRGGTLAQLPRAFEELTYVPLTEASLGDVGFMRTTAALFDSSYFAPARGLVLRIPETIGASGNPEDRLEACLTALANGGSRAPLAPSRNAWWATEDVSAATLTSAANSVTFFAHETFDFWRAPPADYRRFRSRKVLANRSRNLKNEFDHLVEAFCGANTEILWRDDDGQAQESAPL